MDIRDLLALEPSIASIKKIDQFLSAKMPNDRDYPKAISHLAYLTYLMGDVSNSFQLLFNYLDKCIDKEKPTVYNALIKIYYEQKDYENVLKMIELKQGEIASPTNDINLTAGLAIIVLVYYVIAGVIKKKHKFLLHEFSFVGIISMLVELLELVTRPLTLALRLFGNILAGEILITALLGLIAWGLPLPIMFFEILVACVQALVFTMLTTVYIATAVNENH